MAKAKKTIDIDWNAVEGNMSIYTNEFRTKSGKGTILKHSVSISSKDSKGEYHNYYLDLKFVKGAEEPTEPGKHIISITNAFLSCDFWTDKNKVEHTKPILVITDCDIVE